jgi:serine/threonine-protein kinase
VGADPDSGVWRIGNYQLEEILKAGGMGVVYRARDISLEEPRVVKVIAGEQVMDPSFRGRFLREMKILRSLKHPHILKVLDSGEWNGTLFIAMPYIEGGDLGAILRREGKLEPARAVAILTQLSGAVDAAHEAEIVHRDINPANV